MLRSRHGHHAGMPQVVQHGPERPPGQPLTVPPAPVCQEPPRHLTGQPRRIHVLVPEPATQMRHQLQQLRRPCRGITLPPQRGTKTTGKRLQRPRHHDIDQVGEPPGSADDRLADLWPRCGTDPVPAERPSRRPHFVDIIPWSEFT